MTLFSPAFGAHVEAKVLDMTGSAQILPRWGVPVDMQKDDTVRPGEVIETGPNSRVILRLMPGVEIMLGKNTRLDIERLEEEEYFGGAMVKRVSLGLGKGNITTSVHVKKNRVTLAINTAHGSFSMQKGTARTSSKLFAMLEGNGSVRTPNGEVFRLGSRQFLYTCTRDGKVLKKHGVLQTKKTDSKK